MKKKMTFKAFGKTYRVRQGGNLHLALEFGKAFSVFACLVIWGLVFAMLAI